MPRGSTMFERIENIFRVILEAERPLSLTHLAKRTGMHYWTAQRYIDLIVDIQNRPRLEKIEAESTVLVRLEKE